MNRPFKVINCLSQGFAVAAVVAGGDGDGEKLPGVDLEMVGWGMSLDRAATMAQELNDEQTSGVHKTPEHVKD